MVVIDNGWSRINLLKLTDDGLDVAKDEIDGNGEAIGVGVALSDTTAHD